MVLTSRFCSQRIFTHIGSRVKFVRYLSSTASEREQYDESRRSVGPSPSTSSENVIIDSVTYNRDDWTNITRKITHLMERGTSTNPSMPKLYNDQRNPLCLLKQRIINHFHSNYRAVTRRSPLFTVQDRLSPIVTTHQNFDSLLVPPDHVSRARSDTYYINKDTLLRAHTSAHQAELLTTGLNAFLVVGDVYRRDKIDSSHFPVFHQMEGVRLFSRDQLFGDVNDPNLRLFETSSSLARTQFKQAEHTVDTAILLERQLKTTLERLAASLFGAAMEFRWTDTTFPFTHPSWELEVKYEGDWLEVLGCGLVEQAILDKAGAGQPYRAGWAFGLGLERLAMRLYDIPDIRLFWSTDTGFLAQFNGVSPEDDVKYVPVSKHPQLINDISFWLPTTKPESTDNNLTPTATGSPATESEAVVMSDREQYHSHDFYDLVRSVAGDLVEQVYLIDEFVHPKTQRHSHAYRIVYRHMERTLTQKEVSKIHNAIRLEAQERFGVELRGTL